jgi:hypothetical protein
MRSDHERKELQHCDVATETPNGPQNTRMLLQLTKKIGQRHHIRHAKKNLTSAQEGTNSNHHERSW